MENLWRTYGVPHHINIFIGMGLHHMNLSVSYTNHIWAGSREKGPSAIFFKKEFFGKSDSSGHTDYRKETISKKACLQVELWSFEVGKFTHKSNTVLLLLCVFRQVALCELSRISTNKPPKESCRSSLSQSLHGSSTDCISMTKNAAATSTQT